MKKINLNTEPKITTGFVIPENYFENFSSKIISKIENEETKVISLYSKRKVWIYAAVAVLVIGLMIPFYHYFKNPLSEIDNQSLENYLVNSSSISENDLTYLLDNRDIENLDIKLNIEDNTIENELSTNTDLELYFIN